MSAHRIYCYGHQKIAVESYLRDLGVVITRDVPHPVDDADQLRGLDHVTFVVIDKHSCAVPQAIWDAVVASGALVIHVDDQHKRDRVQVRHYNTKTENDPLMFSVLGVYPADWSEKDISNWTNPCVS